jgi:hypothetical protein
LNIFYVSVVLSLFFRKKGNGANFQDHLRNIDPVLGPLHRVDVGSITGVTETYAVSVLRIEITCIPEAPPALFTSTRCKDPKGQSTSTLKYHVLSVLRGNFTLPRNTVTNDRVVFKFPQNGLDGRETITHFVSIDRSGNTNGAMAYLVSGGVGFKRVSVGYNFKQIYGMDHEVEIYGR